MSTSSCWEPSDEEAIRAALGLLATVPCLDAIRRAMADLEQQHPVGVVRARALLTAVETIDQQLLKVNPGQEMALQRQSFSGPVASSSAAAGEAPLQKADVIEYDTALLRLESEKVFSNPVSTNAALLLQRRRLAEQLLLLLPALRGWVMAALGPGCTALERG
jgi:hypothetical protein